MSGFTRYQFISYIRSLKIVPPLTVFGAWVIIFYTYKGVPILSSYAVTSLAIYLVMTWVTIGIFSIQGETEKHLLFVQLGSKHHYLWGKWAICLIIASFFMLFAIVYPVLMNNFKETIQPIHFGLSIYSHFFLAIFGIIVGSFFSITSFASTKYTWLLAMLVVTISISYEGIVEKVALFKWILLLFPPVVHVIKYLSGNDAVTIKLDFWLIASFAFVYTIISFIVVSKMFLQKEK